MCHVFERSGVGMENVNMQDTKAATAFKKRHHNLKYKPQRNPNHNLKRTKESRKGEKEQITKKMKKDEQELVWIIHQSYEMLSCSCNANSALRFSRRLNAQQGSVMPLLAQRTG